MIPFPRVIAKLEVKGENVIKGIHLEGVRAVGNPEQLAKKYYEQGIDEIIYIDSVASLYGRNNLEQVVRAVSNHIFVPLTVGGGIRSLEDIRILLRQGADKVAVNSYAILQPDFIRECVKCFGSQCIVGSVHAKRTGNGTWASLYNYGREMGGQDAVSWACELASLGVGELLITSVDQDGTFNGFDLELINKIASQVPMPVVASGGGSSNEQILDVLVRGEANAVALASTLHFNHNSVGNIKGYLKKRVSEQTGSSSGNFKSDGLMFNE